MNFIFSFAIFVLISKCFGLNTTNAGLYVQISQKGLDYIAKLAEQAVPEMIKNVSIPDTDGSGFTISNFTIDEFSPPNISSIFIPETGIESELLLPHALITANYEGGIGWWTKKGRFKAQITNLKLKTVISVLRDAKDRPLITIPTCNGTTEKFVVVFGGGWSGILNAIRGFVQSYIQQELDTILCDLTVKTAQMLSDVEDEAPTQVLRDSGKPAFNPALLCKTSSTNRRRGKKQKKKFIDFTMNFDLATDPFFSRNNSVLGFDGGIMYRNITAKIEKPLVEKIPESSKMASFAVSEYLPNTFFAHVAANRLGRMSSSVGVNNLPGWMKTAMTLVCWGCEIRLLAHLTRRPEMEISKDKGVFLTVTGNTRIVFEGTHRQSDIVNADTSLTINVKPYVRYGRLYGKIKLTNVDVSVKKVGIGGIMANSIGSVLEMIIPKQIWPQIKRRLRFALNRRGIKLPVVCAVELINTKIHYVENAIIVDTDFEYNLENFLERWQLINS